MDLTGVDVSWLDGLQAVMRKIAEIHAVMRLILLVIVMLIV